uniref:Uncharacterized protein n=1 Tax=Romanomermis culicivorax TaxID=13658 RepID=A0A915IHY4_ROMCU
RALLAGLQTGRIFIHPCRFHPALESRTVALGVRDYNRRQSPIVELIVDDVNPIGFFHFALVESGKVADEIPTESATKILTREANICNT